MSLNVEQARYNMVEQQVRPWDVLDARVLDVLASVRREDFVPAAHRNLAFADLSLPLGHGEVMMKPVVEGRVLQALALEPDERVLEIGTGSGFLTACLARLAGEVVSIDRHADFVEAARRKLQAAGIGNVRADVADAMRGFKPGQEFDAVVVTGAVYTLPERFRDWVKIGGRLFVIEGESPAMQARLLTRRSTDAFESQSLFETDLPYLSDCAPPKRFTF